MNNKVKDIIKCIYYSKGGKLLRTFPEKWTFERKRKELQKNLHIINNKRKSYPIKIVFIVEYPEIWNSSKTIFESLSKRKNVEAYILAMPQYPNLLNNEAYDFFSNMYLNVFKGYDTTEDKWFELEKLNPDYVFYTRPYDKEYPDVFKPKMVSKYAKLCYVPYGYEFVRGYHVEVEYNLKTFPYLYMVFNEGETSYDYCVRLCDKGFSDKHIFKIGYPRFDLLYSLKKQQEKNQKDIKTVLWTPRWSIEKLANDGTSYFEFIDPLLNYFSLHKDIELVIRPHPLMFKNFIKMGVMTNEEVDKIHQCVEEMKNVYFDSNKDYLQSVYNSDFIISDYTSMLLEYIILDKPVLYCGQSKNFDNVGNKLNSAMYQLNDYKNIIDAIDHIRSYGDTISLKRREIIEELTNGFDGKSGERIVTEIINDYEVAFGEFV